MIKYTAHSLCGTEAHSFFAKSSYDLKEKMIGYLDHSKKWYLVCMIRNKSCEGILEKGEKTYTLCLSFTGETDKESYDFQDVLSHKNGHYHNDRNRVTFTKQEDVIKYYIKHHLEFMKP